MPRQPEIGNVAIYPNRPLRKSDRNGYVLKFYCPIKQTRIRKNCGTRDRREAGKIQKECQKRLINGEYIASGGAITKEQEDKIRTVPPAGEATEMSNEMTWEAASEHYRNQSKRRQRRKSTQDSFSRIDIAGRIFEAKRANLGLPPGATLRECCTFAAMEELQNELLEGAEGRYDFRSPNTVNSMMGAILAFVRYCKKHGWIEQLPEVEKIEVEDVMRGRPITSDEFGRILEAVPRVVGQVPAPSWRFVLHILWESGFRIGDVMNFSWDDEMRIHPVWPSRADKHATIKIPSSQKNRKIEEIPMLPGLKILLNEVGADDRIGFVVNPLPIEYAMKCQRDWFMPNPDDLQSLIEDYSNVAIAKACGVSDPTVGKWVAKLVLKRHGKTTFYGQEVPREVIEPIRKRAGRRTHRRSMKRLSAQRVSEVICAIGQEAGVVVRQPDEETGQRIKYASAHDLRRSLAERLINSGVSAETLMVVMRHKDFATTKKFYGATRAAQSAATEIHRKLTPHVDSDALVGG